MTVSPTTLMSNVNVIQRLPFEFLGEVCGEFRGEFRDEFRGEFWGEFRGESCCETASLGEYCDEGCCESVTNSPVSSLDLLCIMLAGQIQLFISMD